MVPTDRSGPAQFILWESDLEVRFRRPDWTLSDRTSARFGRGLFVLSTGQNLPIDIRYAVFHQSAGLRTMKL